jgi:hypothetical protein
MFLNSTTEIGDEGILISESEGLSLKSYLPPSLNGIVSQDTVQKFITR